MDKNLWIIWLSLASAFSNFWYVAIAIIFFSRSSNSLESLKKTENNTIKSAIDWLIQEPNLEITGPMKIILEESQNFWQNLRKIIKGTIYFAWSQGPLQCHWIITLVCPWYHWNKSSTKIINGLSLKTHVSNRISLLNRVNRIYLLIVSCSESRHTNQTKLNNTRVKSYFS